MRLIALRLNNFRQFYGKSPEINFASGVKNVTVIHGTNGSGKTALLNAFTWGLYSQFTKGFLLEDQLVNKRAIAEAIKGEPIETWVEITFEHDGRKYSVKRSQQVLKKSDENDWSLKGDSVLSLQWAGPDGRWKNEDRAQDVINRILPEDLHTYFFFDGERIERIVQPTKKEREEIATAANKLLGIEIIERAQTHLNYARKEFERELKEIGDPEVKILLEEKNAAEQEIAETLERQKQIDLNIEGQEKRKKEIEKRLRDLEEVRNIQMRRDQLNKDKEARLESFNNTKIDLCTLTSSQAYAVFLNEASNDFRNIIDSLRKRGELPAGIKRQFVKDLLEFKKMCICERPLKEGTDPYPAVERWMNRSGIADVEEKAIRMGGEVAKIEQQIPQFWEQLDRLQNKRQVDREEISRIETELEDIRSKLKGSPKEVISDLQRQLEDVDNSIHEYEREKGGNNEKIKILRNKIEDLQSKITKHKTKLETQRQVLRRVEATSDAHDRIGKVRKIMTDQFRKSLLKRITRLFSTISFTPYVPAFTEDFSLYLLDSQGAKPLPVATSQGESQILSLAFIGSVIEEAREYHAKVERLPSPDSSTYPVVMDSPFGSLGPTYRSQTAEHIPRLASQVVMMVSNTQWKGEVEQTVKNRIGQQYVLVYYSPKENREKESLEINRLNYELIVHSTNGYEYTEILEAKNG
jgi:DNA sulfur modification protein DndD